LSFIIVSAAVLQIKMVTVQFDFVPALVPKENLQDKWQNGHASRHTTNGTTAMKEVAAKILRVENESGKQSNCGDYTFVLRGREKK